MNATLEITELSHRSTYDPGRVRAKIAANANHIVFAEIERCFHDRAIIDLRPHGVNSAFLIVELAPVIDNPGGTISREIGLMDTI